MRIAITGGAGFIGSHVADLLASTGHRILALDDLSNGSVTNLARWAEGPSSSAYSTQAAVTLRRVDIRDRAALNAAFAAFEPAAVLHLAAVASVPRSVAEPLLASDVNLGGTANVLEAARCCGARRFVFASSGAVYGPQPRLPSAETDPVEPASPYAAHKAAGELLARAYRAAWGSEACSVRFLNVYGPRQRADDPYAGVISLFSGKLRAGQRATITGDGGETRDYIYVDDVARAVAAALLGPDPGAAPINVGSGTATSVRTLHTLLAGLLGVPDDPLFAPPRPGDVRHSQARVDRMRERLGVEAQVSIAEGLRRLLAWQADA